MVRHWLLVAIVILFGFKLIAWALHSRQVLRPTFLLLHGLTIQLLAYLIARSSPTTLGGAAPVVAESWFDKTHTRFCVAAAIGLIDCLACLAQHGR